MVLLILFLFSFLQSQQPVSYSLGVLYPPFRFIAVFVELLETLRELRVVSRGHLVEFDVRGTFVPLKVFCVLLLVRDIKLKKFLALSLFPFFKVSTLLLVHFSWVFNFNRDSGVVMGFDTFQSFFF